MSFNGDQYPSNAAKVITTRGDIVRGNSSGERSRYGIGAANTVLTSDGTDPSWAAHGGVPTTTKGDISGFSTTQARIPISTNNYSLLADSAQALGLKWAASSTSTLTTTGDLLAASAANTLSRIAGGASGEVLTGNGAGVLPTFQAAGGGNASTVFTALTGGSFSSSATSFVAITGATHAIPSVASGKCMNNFSTGITNGAGAYALKVRMVDDDTGSEFTGICLDPYHSGYGYMCVLNGINDADGQDVYMEFQQDAGGASTLYANSGSFMTLSAFAM